MWFGNEVGAACRRTDLVERRRLMNDWAEYLAGRRACTDARLDPATGLRWPFRQVRGASRVTYGAYPLA